MKPTDLKCFQQVAAVLGEERATVELQRVIDTTTGFKILHVGAILVTSFSWRHSPQGAVFWGAVNRGVRPSVPVCSSVPIGRSLRPAKERPSRSKWLHIYRVREELL